MTKKAASRAQPTESRTNVTLIVALIGMIGVVAAATINYFGTRFQSEFPPQATQAAQAQLTLTAAEIAASAVSTPNPAELTVTAVFAGATETAQYLGLVTAAAGTLRADLAMRDAQTAVAETSAALVTPPTLLIEATNTLTSTPALDQIVDTTSTAIAEAIRFAEVLATSVVQTVEVQLTATQAAATSTPIPDCAGKVPPCQYRVKSKQTYTDIALEKFGNYTYTSLLIDVNRNDDGMRRPLQPDMVIKIPNADVKRTDLFPECFDVSSSKPCFFMGQTDVSFVDLAIRFYGDASHAENLEIHNEFFDPNLPQDLIDAHIVPAGVLVIIPKFP